MIAILQTTFWNVFLWIKTILPWFKFQWAFSLKVPVDYMSALVQIMALCRQVTPRQFKTVIYSGLNEFLSSAYLHYSCGILLSPRCLFLWMLGIDVCLIIVVVRCICTQYVCLVSIHHYVIHFGLIYMTVTPIQLHIPIYPNIYPPLWSSIYFSMVPDIL